MTLNAWTGLQDPEAPKNIREGEPYNDPNFEELARTYGVWGTAQAALCAEFWQAARRAPAAPAPQGWKLVPDEVPDEMVDAAIEAYMPFGDMRFAIVAALTAAPQPPEAVPKASKLRQVISDVLDEWHIESGDIRHYEALTDELFAAITKANAKPVYTHPTQQGLDADTLLRVIRRLNQNPYSLTKCECIAEVQAMREEALAAQAKQGGA